MTGIWVFILITNEWVGLLFTDEWVGFLYSSTLDGADSTCPHLATSIVPLRDSLTCAHKYLVVVRHVDVGMYVCMYGMYVRMYGMYVCMYNVSKYYQKLKRPSEGIAGADCAGRSTEGVCDLCRLMWIKKSVCSNFHFMGSPTHMKQEPNSDPYI